MHEAVLQGPNWINREKEKIRWRRKCLHWRQVTHRLEKRQWIERSKTKAAHEEATKKIEEEGGGERNLPLSLCYDALWHIACLHRRILFSLSFILLVSHLIFLVLFTFLLLGVLLSPLSRHCSTGSFVYILRLTHEDGEKKRREPEQVPYNLSAEKRGKKRGGRSLKRRERKALQPQETLAKFADTGKRRHEEKSQRVNSDQATWRESERKEMESIRKKKKEHVWVSEWTNEIDSTTHTHYNTHHRDEEIQCMRNEEQVNHDHVHTREKKEQETHEERRR